MNFEAYLISKKIDSGAFHAAEPALWKQWNDEFDQVHPNSFTSQKLNLINPTRRKYPHREITPAVRVATEATVSMPAPAVARPKPMMKPKPKIG